MKYLLDGEKTSRLRFRRIDQSDFENWVSFFQDPESFRYWNVKLESPEIECRKWYEKQSWRYEHDKGGMNALVEKSSGKLVGHCGLLVQNVDHENELEIGYSILSPFWNKGFASEAAAKCRDVAFERNYARSLISIISLTNAPSARVALKNGMSIDKRTVYYDNDVNIFRIRHEQWVRRNQQ